MNGAKIYAKVKVKKGDIQMPKLNVQTNDKAALMALLQLLVSKCLKATGSSFEDFVETYKTYWKK